MKCFTTSCLILLAVLATAAQGVTIETIPVGNLGNDDDTHGDGYGGVDYAYNIGKFEVTAGQYTEFLNAVAGVDAYGLYNGDMWSSALGCKIEIYDGSGIAGDPYQYRVPDANRVNRPVNYVSWGDAARFANWLHNGQPTGILTGDPVLDAGLIEDGAYDLNGSISQAALMAVSREADWKWSIPTEDEWYKAAYHKNNGNTGNYFEYPTSSDARPGNDLVEPTDPGNNATFWWDNYTINLPYYRTEIGAHENSVSPYGTLDQGGNVYEWNDADIFGTYRGRRGGGWGSNGRDLNASYRSYNPPSSEGRYTGFRVVSVVPEPTTITLLLCGLAGLAMLGRRRYAQYQSGNYRIPNVRLPRNPAKTSVSLQWLAKAADKGKITLNPGKNRLFGVFSRYFRDAEVALLWAPESGSANQGA